MQFKRRQIVSSHIPLQKKLKSASHYLCKNYVQNTTGVMYEYGLNPFIRCTVYDTI